MTAADPTAGTRRLLPAAELALLGVSLAAVVGFGRLFDGGSFFWRLTAAVVVAHAIPAIARRLGWPLPVALVASAAAGVLTLGLLFYGDTTFAGLPTGETIDLLRADFRLAWEQFQEVKAPTPATAPFLLVAALALWAAAFVADWAAFRLWVPFESIVPAGTIFVFASLFAADQAQVLSAGLFAGTVLAFLLVHRVTRQQASTGWVSSDTGRAARTSLRIGGALSAAAVLAAIVLGPNLPQARSEALVGWRGGGEGGAARTTISPLVQIQPRLLTQSFQELFTVRSSRPAYWRLTSLDEFDGAVWSSNGEYDRAEGSLPKDIDSDAPSTIVDQTYTLGTLGTIWMPAAFRPERVEAGDAPVRFEAASSTLIVGSERENSDGLVYTVQSALPSFDPNALAGASGEVPGEILEQDLQVPGSLSPGVRQLALDVTAGASNDYARALALQQYFRDNFTYSLEVTPGHSDSAIERFLFETREGYCEQFAGTYAAMARSIGIPARVAVGFTKGDEDPSDPGLYHVRGEHAHAWPEVYIPTQGWVLFEPTPGRGAPNAEQYTSVREEQSSSGGASATTAPDATATTVVAGGGAPSTVPTEPGIADPGGGTAGTAGTESWWDSWGRTAALVIAVVVALAAAYAVAVPLAHRLRRDLRRRRAGDDAAAQVRAAWDEAVEAVSLLGIASRQSETPVELATRAGSVVAPGALHGLATALEAADYSAEPVPETAVDEAWAMSGDVIEDVHRQTTRRERVRSALDPRPPHRRGPRNRGRGPRARREGPAIEIVSMR